MIFNLQVFLAALFLAGSFAGALISLGLTAWREKSIYLLGLIPSVICMATGFAFVT